MKSCWKAWPLAALASLFTVLPVIANAQDTNDKPTPPFVAAVPDFFQWTITVDESAGHPKPTASPSTRQPAAAQAANANKPPPVIAKVVCTKTKNITCNVIFYDNGKSSEIWYFNRMVIIRTPGNGVSIDTAGTYTASLSVPDVSGEGFVGVDWISAANFSAKTKLDKGRPAFVYRGIATGSKSAVLPGNGGASSGPRGIVGPAEATIDAETRLPLLIKLATRTLIYSYQAPPAQMLALPADAQERVTEIEGRQDFIEKLRALSQHHEPPPE